MSINIRLKELRKALKKSQRQFSADLGIEQTHLSRYELGKLSLPNRVLFTLAEYYDVNTNWLLTGVGEMFASQELNKQHEDEDPLIDPIKDAYIVINKVAKSTFISPYKAVEILKLVKTMAEEGIKEATDRIKTYDAVKSTHKPEPSSD